MCLWHARCEPEHHFVNSWGEDLEKVATVSLWPFRLCYNLMFVNGHTHTESNCISNMDFSQIRLVYMCVCIGKVKNLDIRNQFFSLRQTFLTSGFLDKRNLENQQTNQYYKGFFSCCLYASFTVKRNIVVYMQVSLWRETLSHICKFHCEEKHCCIYASFTVKRNKQVCTNSRFSGFHGTPMATLIWWCYTLQNQSDRFSWWPQHRPWWQGPSAPHTDSARNPVSAGCWWCHRWCCTLDHRCMRTMSLLEG